MHPNVTAVQDALDAADSRNGSGARSTVRMLADAASTAALAAAALGVEVGQIANSLIFDADGEPLLILTSGAHRVDVAKVTADLGLGQVQAGHPGVRPRAHRADHRRGRAARAPEAAAHPGGRGAGRVPGDLGGRRHRARGVPDDLRRTGPGHRRHPRRGGVTERLREVAA